MSISRIPYALAVFVFTAGIGLGPTTAQTGIAVPQLTGCDAQLQSLLSTYNIPGASFALSRQGKLVYDRAFGHADLAGTEPLLPSHRFRLASVSKPITGVAVMAAVQQGLLSLDDHPFGPDGLLADHPYLGQVAYTDQRLEQVTLRQLLQHTGGWDRGINCFPWPTTPYALNMPGCDPIVVPLYITDQLGEANPVDKFMLVRFLMEHGLDHDPGTTYAYSNIGYLVAGICIEQVTGLTYEAFVQQLVEPIGVCDLQVGNNLLAGKLEREVEYRGEGGLTLDLYGSGQMVPWEYGGLNVNAMDAHGGWVCRARDLVKLVAAVDGFTSVPDIITAASVTTMTTPSSANANYALGWQVNSNNNWWHTGSIDGTATMVVRSGTGYNWALLLNKRLTNAQANAFWNAVDALGWNCVSSATSWPTHDLMAIPTQSTTAVQAVAVGGGMAQVQWTPGNGDGRLVVVRPAAAPVRFPVDGVDYLAPNTDYGTGSDLGDGNFVVSIGDATETDVTGLPVGEYVVHVYEYNSNSATGQHTLYRLCDRSDVPVTIAVGVSEHTAAASVLKAWIGADGLRWTAESASSSATLRVLDATGRIVHDGVSVKRTTPLPLDAGAGLYLVVLVDQGAMTGVARVMYAGR